MINLLSIFCLVVIVLYVTLLALFPPSNKIMKIGLPENGIGFYAPKSNYNGNQNIVIDQRPDKSKSKAVKQ